METGFLLREEERGVVSKRPVVEYWPFVAFESHGHHLERRWAMVIRGDDVSAQGGFSLARP